MKIIAVPTNGNQIEDHFGHCEFYTTVKVNDKNEIISKETFSAPRGSRGKSDLVKMLAEKGVTLMIAGNMGQGAKNVLSGSGITVLCGFTGNIDHALNLYLNEGFQGNDATCNQHQHQHHGRHDCNH